MENSGKQVLLAAIITAISVVLAAAFANPDKWAAVLNWSKGAEESANSSSVPQANTIQPTPLQTQTPVSDPTQTLPPVRTQAPVPTPTSTPEHVAIATMSPPTDTVPANVGALPPFNERSSWGMQVVGCHVDEEYLRKVDRFVRNDLGFSTAMQPMNNHTRQDWPYFARTSSVLYYAKSQRGTAVALARALEARFDINLSLQMGATPNAPETMFVHLIADGC